MGAFLAQPNQPAFESGRSVVARCGECVLFKLQTERTALARGIQISSQIDLLSGCTHDGNHDVLFVL